MSVQLAFDRVDGTQPERAIAFLPGILGRGVNLRSLAKGFVEARPGWSAWLVDLRGHGRSPKSTPDPSLEAAARDVVELAQGTPPPLSAIVGHSFGGKVGMEAARIGGIESLQHLVVLDSAPGLRTLPESDDSALAVIDVLEALPPSFASITKFAEAVVAAGLSQDLAQWLAGSTARDGDRVRFALDLQEIRALLLDYSRRDLWAVVEQPPGLLQVHLVIADRSSTYSPADRERAARIAAFNERVTVDVLPTSHWIHAEDPEGLLRAILRYIPPQS